MIFPVKKIFGRSKLIESVIKFKNKEVENTGLAGALNMN